jgi:hypothetical protein
MYDRVNSCFGLTNTMVLFLLGYESMGLRLINLFE